MKNIRVRFAPSPTGLMHVGNARTALFNWLFARKHNGQFILRIEDTDEKRSTEESTDKILRDLSWMHLDWDESFDKGGEFGPYRQSARTAIYETHLKQLQEKGCVYECFCSQDELKAMREEQLFRGEMPRYDNRCRNLTDDQKKAFQDEGHLSVLRFRVSKQKIVFKDIVRGTMTFNSSNIGDFVLRKSTGGVTFNFAVSVDDACMQISHVIRGEDHLTNTARHVLLLDAMGYVRPLFAHLPMILGDDGSKMSKRNGLVSLDVYRDEGVFPEALCNYMSLLGWSPGRREKEILSLGELVERFSLEDVSKSPATFDLSKLKWVNSHYLREMALDRVTLMAQGFFREAGLIKEDLNEEEFAYLLSVVEAVRENVNCLAEMPAMAAMFFKKDIDFSEPEVIGVLQVRTSKDILLMFRESLRDLEDPSKEEIQDILQAIKESVDAKGKALFGPIRFGLTGRGDGVELYKVIALLGVKTCMERLNKAILV